jgi:regulatory protein
MKKNTNISPERARDILMKLCSVKEMCRFDLSRKLELWGIEQNDREKILKYLEKEKFFSDKRFSAAFINDKLRFQKWGGIKIKHALMTKRISEDIVDELLQDSNGKDYTERLEDLLRKKLRTVKPDTSKQQIRARLYRFALGKGYEPDLIFKVLDNVINE